MNTSVEMLKTTYMNVDGSSCQANELHLKVGMSVIGDDDGDADCKKPKVKVHKTNLKKLM